VVTSTVRIPREKKLPKRVVHQGARPRRLFVPWTAAVLVWLGAAGCGVLSPTSSGHGAILAVGAENQYASVISQIGGRYVTVAAIMSNPNTDPHSFEASASVAQTVGTARLIVQNGLGYDDFMAKIESASPSSSRKVINVQKLLGLPGSTPNPHLWYSPRTMPAVAKALVDDLSALAPAHAAYFRANASSFDRSLQPWLRSLRQFSARYPRTSVASTEPVGDYMLDAAGIRNLTPFSLQADTMNGTDPAPQSISLQDDLLAKHLVKAILYNEQVTDSLTQSFLDAARRADIPVVGLYETMPSPGYDYQSWMTAELGALEKAVADKTSTPKL
jgi:zinc/manganese transport system substrate-binding protein